MHRTWGQFLQERASRAERALFAARALARGDRSPTLDLLSPWLFVTDRPDWAARVLDRLTAHPPLPSPKDYAMVFAHYENVGDGGSPLPETAHRARLFAVVEPLPVEDPIAWGLAELLAMGEWMRFVRARWATERPASMPEQDAQAAQLWAAWGTSNPWSALSVWDELYRPVARRAFGAQLIARGLPPGERPRVLEAFDEGAFFKLSDFQADPPGWTSLAARVLETADEGPVESLLGSSQARERAAGCAATRGVRARSLAWLEPDSPVAAQRRDRLVDPGAPLADSFLDAHVALRLLEQWGAGRCTSYMQGRNVAAQGWTRARGRLRAVAATEPDGLIERVLALDCLHARTTAALGRLVASWALDEYPSFSFDHERPLLSPCRDGEPLPPALDETEAAIARTWILLVILRGRWGHLRAWTEHGGTGDRDKTWGRLQEQVPDALCTSAGGRTRGYARLRAYLLEELEVEVEALRPLLRQIADLGAALETRSGRRALPGQLRELLGAVWVNSERLGDPAESARPELPRGGYPTAVEAAVDFLDLHA